MDWLAFSYARKVVNERGRQFLNLCLFNRNINEITSFCIIKPEPPSKVAVRTYVH
jgi:hypothetical protein